VILCAGLVLLASRTHAGIVPPKAGLSLKDKLARDIPLKQLLTDKTGEKSETIKVGFPTTPSTTTTAEVGPNKRPDYIDATVFRHQFTTPRTSASTTDYFSPVDDPSDSVDFFSSHRIPESVLGLREGELDLETDNTSETFESVVPSSGDQLASAQTETLTAGVSPSSSTTETPTKARSPTTASPATTTPTTTTTTTTAPPTTAFSISKDLEFSDYDTRFRLMDDLASFGGELGFLGVDRRGEEYISGFRPIDF
ncbi:hypothetical protein SK128_020698, partial [Halocaridina rubra]